MNKITQQLALLLLSELFIIVMGTGCKQATKTQTAEITKQSLPDTTLIMSNNSEEQSNTTNAVDTVKIVIDMDYFETKKEGKQIEYDDVEYYKYGITSFHTLGMTSDDRFVWDATHISFSIIGEVELYDNIYSLIIRGDTEYTMGIWLVNYDMNSNISSNTGIDFYKYIDSYPVGYDEWAEGASIRKSIIYILPESYIEQEYIHWEDLEDSKIEILKSGKFKVTETVRSKCEM